MKTREQKIVIFSILLFGITTIFNFISPILQSYVRLGYDFGERDFLYCLSTLSWYFYISLSLFIFSCGFYYIFKQDLQSNINNLMQKDIIKNIDDTFDCRPQNPTPNVMKEMANKLDRQHFSYLLLSFLILGILIVFYGLNFDPKDTNLTNIYPLFIKFIPFTIAGYVLFAFFSKRANTSYMLSLQYKHRATILFMLNDIKDEPLRNIIYGEVVKFEIPTNKPHKNEIDDAIDLITKLKELNKNNI
jgi:hypothetical protein